MVVEGDEKGQAGLQTGQGELVVAPWALTTSGARAAISRASARRPGETCPAGGERSAPAQRPLSEGRPDGTATVRRTTRW